MQEIMLMTADPYDDQYDRMAEDIWENLTDDET